MCLMAHVFMVRRVIRRDDSPVSQLEGHISGSVEQRHRPQWTDILIHNAPTAPSRRNHDPFVLSVQSPRQARRQYGVRHRLGRRGH